MTTRFKKLAVVFVIFLLSVLGWNLYVWYRLALLADMSVPFLAACQTAAGCILAPDGWRFDSSFGGYYNGFYEYTATKDDFTLRQHLATDVWLVAEGGRGKPVHAYRVVD